MAKAEILFIYVVCASRKEAENIAEALVRKRLAACANVLGECKSFFRWEGKFEERREVVVVMKATSSKYSRLEHAIKKMHSYENHAIVALPIAAGSKAYLKWIEESCG